MVSARLTTKIHRPCLVIPDIISASAFLAKQYQRHMMNASTLQALEKRVKERADQDERTFSTVTEYLQGLWDFFLGITALAWAFTIDKRLWYHPVRKPSLLRETSYELITVMITAVPFIVALILRLELVPRNRIENKCTGCIIEWQDILITSVLVMILMLPAAVLVYKVKSLNIPDPLFSLLDNRRA